MPVAPNKERGSRIRRFFGDRCRHACVRAGLNLASFRYQVLFQLLGTHYVLLQGRVYCTAVHVLRAIGAVCRGSLFWVGT